MDVRFEQAKEFFLAGVEHFKAGRWDLADQKFSASLVLMPGRPATLLNLGATRLRQGRPQEALELLDEALAAEPDDTTMLSHRAEALAHLGRREEAHECLCRLLALDGQAGGAWSLRGTLARELGRPEEAAECFRQALAHGADAAMNGYFLASLGGQEAPAGAPRLYVEQLFDSYAGGFDEHLVEVLNYRAHSVLGEGVRALGRRFARALDLGCGTGLVGAQVRPLVDRLEGVDLSGAMVAQACARGLYDEVAQEDVVTHLRAAQGPYDLVLAADVFIYVGALPPVFEQVARLVPAGGAFCFSVEEATGGEDLALRPSMRYVHSERSIRALAAQHGFTVHAVQRQPIREEQLEPIPGLYAWLLKT